MLPQKLVTCQPVRRFPTCYYIYRNPLLGPLLSQTNPIHTLTFYFFQTHFNILSSMPMSSKCPLSARFSHHNPVCISLLSYAFHKPKPLHPPSFGCSTHISIWPGVQIMKLLIMQFSASSYRLYPLTSKYIPQHPVLKHPCFVIKVFSPTDAQLDSLKNNCKFALKSSYMFQCKTPSSGNTLSEPC